MCVKRIPNNANYRIGRRALWVWTRSQKKRTETFSLIGIIWGLVFRIPHHDDYVLQCMQSILSVFHNILKWTWIRGLLNHKVSNSSFGLCSRRIFTAFLTCGFMMFTFQQLKIAWTHIIIFFSFLIIRQLYWRIKYLNYEHFNWKHHELPL